MHFRPTHHFRGIVVLVDGLHATPAYVTLTLVEKKETLVSDTITMVQILSICCFGHLVDSVMYLQFMKYQVEVLE